MKFADQVKLLRYFTKGWQWHSETSKKHFIVPQTNAKAPFLTNAVSPYLVSMCANARQTAVMQVHTSRCDFVLPTTTLYRVLHYIPRNVSVRLHQVTIWCFDKKQFVCFCSMMCIFI